ncbi:hypothetical protein SB778_03840 [Paraburkholderia sp. SIMBA_050]
MIVRKFVLKEHRETGFVGWRPSWLPHFDPMEGLGVAHDTLEHMGRDKGTVEEEFMAFGAIVWIREGGGWFQRHSPHQPDVATQMEGDFAENAHYLDGMKLRAAPATRRLDEDWAESAIERCVEQGMRLLRSEFPGISHLIEPQDAHSYMRMGYRRTARRFAHTSEWRIAELFDRIASRASRELENAEDEGAELIVRVDTRRHQVHVERSNRYD